jgi:hypothetical protein
MFPIPSKQLLSLAEIASCWRREIKPTASVEEVLNLLSKAWWRGDLVTTGAGRVGLLRTLYQLYSDCIAFVVAGHSDPPQTRELADGSVEVVLWRVPLPNFEQNSWDDSNCSEAFNAVAEFWDCGSFPLLTPIIVELKTTEKEFTRWVDSQEYPAPSFWAHSEEEKLPSPNKRLSERRAEALAADYFRAEKGAGREPTQQGFETKMREEGIVGGRDLIRTAFKKVARFNEVIVRRGRPPAQRA